MQTKRFFTNYDLTISQEKCDHGWSMPYTHFHNSYEIYILESGERIVTIDNEDYITTAHTAVLINRNIAHASRGDSPYTGICIHIQDSFFDSNFTPSAKSHLLKCFRKNVIQLNNSDFNILKSIADKFIIHAPDNFIHLAVILNIMNNNIHDITNVHIDKALHTTKAEKIITYVNENYIEIKSLSELEKIFSVSSSYIFRIFKNKYSMTPKQYINKLRLLNVRHRLIYSDVTVKSIALENGFNCYEYFSRIFKKKFGCTPSKYSSDNST